MRKLLPVLPVFVALVLLLVSCSGPGKDADRVQIASEYTDDIFAQDWSSLSGYSLTFRMRWILNKKAYEAVKEEIESEFGTFIERLEATESTSGKYQVVTIVCRFSEKFGNINVVFDRNNKIAGLNYTYNKTYSDDDRDIEVSFGSDYVLPGSMLVPDADEDVPAVIIVHGSGAMDRDGVVGGNAIYYDIANKLYDKGIASLRYDKRTYVYKDSADYDMDSFTVYDETIDDVVAAYNFLSKQKGIDSDRIYIIGHSLGGYLMPRIARELPDAAGFIMLAPNASHLEDLMVEQMKYILGLEGGISKSEKKALEKYEETRDLIKDLKPGDEYDPSELFNAPVSYWLDLKDYDPLSEIKDVERPILIIHGNRDYQVDFDEFELWHDAVADMPNAESVLLDGINHMMAFGEGESNPQEYFGYAEVDDFVIGLISDFIQGNN